MATSPDEDYVLVKRNGIMFSRKRIGDIFHINHQRSRKRHADVTEAKAIIDFLRCRHAAMECDFSMDVSVHHGDDSIVHEETINAPD